MPVNEALREMLAKARPDAALDGLYAEAQRRGLKIGRNTIARARRGEIINPTEETLVALADLFGLDVRDLRAAAGRQRGELGPYIPTPRASSLTQAQRAALDALIVSIVEGAHHGTQAPQQAPITQAPGSGAQDNVTPLRQQEPDLDEVIPGSEHLLANAAPKKRKPTDDEAGE